MNALDRLRKNPAKWLVLALGLVAIALIGCGGGDSDNGGATESNGGDAGETAAASGDPIKIGVIGARVGPISNIGTGVGDAVLDWAEYVNAEGGVDGQPIEVVEVESQYEVPRGLEAYQRLKQEGVVAVLGLGSAISDAVLPLAEKDKIPLLFPGQGNADTVDGNAYPYGFPAAPTYPDQAVASLRSFMETWEGDGEPRIACIAWDAPPGAEYCDAVEAAANELGAEVVVRNAVSPTALDAEPQVLEVKQANPDATFHSTAFKQAAAVLSAYCNQDVQGPLYTWHWSLSENEIEGAGANCAEKAQYGGTSIARLPATNPPALEMLREFWDGGGKGSPDTADNNQTYGVGLAIAQIMIEGVRLAAEDSDDEVTGEDVKGGLESISDFDANGTICPTTMSSEDHGGSQELFVFRFENGQFGILDECVDGSL